MFFHRFSSPHLIVGKNWDDWTGDAAGCFNQETQTQFEILADDFLDPEGCVPTEDRCFVAATSVLVRMSQVHRLLSGRFRIDENDAFYLIKVVKPIPALADLTFVEIGRGIVTPYKREGAQKKKGRK